MLQGIEWIGMVECVLHKCSDVPSVNSGPARAIGCTVMERIRVSVRGVCHSLSRYKQQHLFLVQDMAALCVSITVYICWNFTAVTLEL